MDYLDFGNFTKTLHCASGFLRGSKKQSNESELNHKSLYKSYLNYDDWSGGGLTFGVIKAESRSKNKTRTRTYAKRKANCEGKVLLCELSGRKLHKHDE